jgi:hypothetical protein
LVLEVTHNDIDLGHIILLVDTEEALQNDDLFSQEAGAEVTLAACEAFEGINFVQVESEARH